MVLLALLLAECLQHEGDSLLLLLTEDTIITCYQPILISEADGVAEGVDFILTLVEEGLHIGVVTGPMAAVGPILKALP